MVIGKHQTLSTHYFTGATAVIQSNDGIFQTSLIDAVDFFLGQIQTHVGHLRMLNAVHECNHPHAFCGCCKKGQRNRDGR